MGFLAVSLVVKEHKTQRASEDLLLFRVNFLRKPGSTDLALGCHGALCHRSPRSRAHRVLRMTWVQRVSEAHEFIRCLQKQMGKSWET